MPRISPASPEQFAQVSDTMERWKKTKGYPPNSWLTMVRRPKVFRAIGWLNRWNSTLATELEQDALVFARKHLGVCWT